MNLIRNTARRVGRLSLTLLALAGACAATCDSALAQQDFPVKPVTLVIPFPPGGGTDTSGRILAEQLGKRWGQPVVVENRGGAAGQIGADAVAKSRPDGYTLLLGNIGTQSINPSLYKRLPYDPDRAFAPVSLVAELPLAMMVNPGVPAHTTAEFIALAKEHPGEMSFSSAGAGGAPHLVAEMFKDRTGTQILHVPYRGGGPAVADLIAGHVQLSFMTVLEASGHIKAGKLRALAVTSSRRVPALPDVPTLAESGLPGFDANSWVGLLAPAGTPAPIVDRIAADVRAILDDPAVKARYVQLGGIPHATTPGEFSKMIAEDRSRYAQIIHARNITAE